MPARKPMPEPDLPERDAPTLELPKNYVPLETPLRKSLIPELYRFVRSLPADAPYDQLGAMAQSAGWIWRMVERDSHSSSPSMYCVRFDVLIGKATNDLELEYFDTISMSVPVEAPSPSLIARLNAQVALTYMVFGRLPPVAVPAMAPQPAPVTPPSEPEPAPVEPDVPWRSPEPPKPEPEASVNMIKRRTPDGLPVLADPYGMEQTPEQLVASILAAFEDSIELPQDRAALTAMWNKNQSAIDFVTDFGSGEDKARLQGLFKTRASKLA